MENDAASALVLIRVWRRTNTPRAVPAHRPPLSLFGPAKASTRSGHIRTSPCRVLTLSQFGLATREYFLLMPSVVPADADHGALRSVRSQSIHFHCCSMQYNTLVHMPDHVLCGTRTSNGLPRNVSTLKVRGMRAPNPRAQTKLDLAGPERRLESRSACALGDSGFQVQIPDGRPRRRSERHDDDGGTRENPSSFRMHGQARRLGPVVDGLSAVRLDRAGMDMKTTRTARPLMFARASR
ncbi:hypothetical protein OH76DRAFT_134662 [Lentinus brumalis]|uniref:Uncharacterized protein n=1 Tax=Lentinus brumalis TaxID=2498619 RepID=A0A371DK60_9APHY|nr:hypothetical protein OH76DRAFT_134662 [Polyporus brumalis]